MGDTTNQKTDRKLLAQYARITGVVALYWFVSISMVFMNKYLLSSPTLKLDAPFFVTWFQCVVSLALCFVFGKLNDFIPQYVSFPSFNIDLKVSREILPLSLIFVAMISFNNLCLKHVGVAFYYIGRSLTTVFNVICTYFILGDKTSMRAVFWCAVIVGGFLLGVDQEDSSGTLSVIGVIYGVAASLSVALNAIYTKRSLPFVGENVWRLTLYNNLNACVIFIPLMVFSGDIFELTRFENLYSAVFWIVLLSSSLFGFGMGFVTGLQIQVTSALTHNISGTAKAAAQTVLAVLVYAESKSVFWWLSNWVVLVPIPELWDCPLVGSMGYTLVRRAEMAARFAAAGRTYGLTTKNGSHVVALDKLNNDREQLLRTNLSDGRGAVFKGSDSGEEVI